MAHLRHLDLRAEAPGTICYFLLWGQAWVGERIFPFLPLPKQTLSCFLFPHSPHTGLLGFLPPIPGSWLKRQRIEGKSKISFHKVRAELVLGPSSWHWRASSIPLLMSWVPTIPRTAPSPHWPPMALQCRPVVKSTEIT